METIRLLERWLPAMRQITRPAPGNPELAYYGTGESAHWQVQSNLGAFAALAVLATAEDLDEKRAGMTRGEIAGLALRLLRYTLATHVGRPGRCTDGRQWGHSWISALGLERMMHGVDAMNSFLAAEDRARLRQVILSEADWLTDHHPVVAGIEAHLNKPESNIWNGCLLLRAATLYPDHPRREEHLRKSTAFLLNGISVPEDAWSDVPFAGRPLSQWHVGANFTSRYALNHHGYLNVGYMVICLSNLAMIHFGLKERGLAGPPELDHHARDLWRTVRMFLFDDGRLLRIGGDTRARYSYCQDYALPMFLHALDRLGDDEAAGHEERWIGQVSRECEWNGDGVLLSRRLASVRRNSLFYYARLEADRAVTLSQAAFWRRRFRLPRAAGTTSPAPACATWSEPFHGAVFTRSSRRVASAVQAGGDGPVILCLPAGRSDMAEWQHNLFGRLATPGNLVPERRAHREEIFPGGFVACCAAVWRETLPLGEGEDRYEIARHFTAAAALPDDRTLLVLQKATMLKDSVLSAVQGLSLRIPNDVFNGCRRRCRAGRRELILEGNPGREENISLPCRSISIDDCLSVVRLDDDEGFTIHRPATRQIAIRRPSPPLMASLYAEEICTTCRTEPAFHPQGSVVIDTACALLAGTGAAEIPDDAGRRPASGHPHARAVWWAPPGGAGHCLVANFGDEPLEARLDGLPAPARYRDLVTGAELPLEHGPLRVMLEACSARLLERLPARAADASP